jgi:hypothetical protein
MQRAGLAGVEERFVPSNSAAAGGASSTIVSLGSAALPPTVMPGCER